jgi:hypothetical protein
MFVPSNVETYRWGTWLFPLENDENARFITSIASLIEIKLSISSDVNNFM